MDSVHSKRTGGTVEAAFDEDEKGSDEEGAIVDDVGACGEVEARAGAGALDASTSAQRAGHLLAKGWRRGSHWWTKRIVANGEDMSHAPRLSSGHTAFISQKWRRL